MRFRFIFNPQSGHNRRDPRLLARVRRFIQDKALDAALVPTEHPGHARRLAREAVALGCDVVVAIGGDGTINEIASSLTGTSATLALLPCGSGNGLGRYLGLPRPDDRAFHTLLHGRIRRIDSGMVNGRPFFNAMGAGFDAVISDRFARLERRGFPAYVHTALSAWKQRTAETYEILVGDKPIITKAMLVAVANSDQYGNNCRIAPGASIDDGLLDLTVIKPIGWQQAPALVYQLFSESVTRSPNVLSLRASAFTINRPGPGLIHTDGEPCQELATLSIRTWPQSLNVLVPPS